MTDFNKNTGMNRRGFLALLAASGTLTLGGRKVVTAWGASADRPSLVWRLDSHWGYPAGPRQKTHCECNACINHARNKVFATKAAAEAGRAHANCVCQPRAVQIDAAKFDTLFPAGADSTDLRAAGVAGAYQHALTSSRAG